METEDEGAYLFVENKFYSEDSWVIGPVNVLPVCPICNKVVTDLNELAQHRVQSHHTTEMASLQPLIDNIPMDIDVDSDNDSAGEMDESPPEHEVSSPPEFPEVPEVPVLPLHDDVHIHDFQIPKVSELKVLKSRKSAVFKLIKQQQRLERKLLKCLKCRLIHKDSKSNMKCLTSQGLWLCKICFQIVPYLEGKKFVHYIKSGHVDSWTSTWTCAFPKCQQKFKCEVSFKSHIGEVHLRKSWGYRNSSPHHDLCKPGGTADCFKLKTAIQTLLEQERFISVVSTSELVKDERIKTDNEQLVNPEPSAAGNQKEHFETSEAIIQEDLPQSIIEADKVPIISEKIIPQLVQNIETDNGNEIESNVESVGDNLIPKDVEAFVNKEIEFDSSKEAKVNSDLEKRSPDHEEEETVHPKSIGINSETQETPDIASSKVEVTYFDSDGFIHPRRLKIIQTDEVEAQKEFTTIQEHVIIDKIAKTDVNDSEVIATEIKKLTEPIPKEVFTTNDLFDHGVLFARDSPNVLSKPDKTNSKKYGEIITEEDKQLFENTLTGYFMKTGLHIQEIPSKTNGSEPYDPFEAFDEDLKSNHFDNFSKKNIAQAHNNLEESHQRKISKLQSQSQGSQNEQKLFFKKLNCLKSNGLQISSSKFKNTFEPVESFESEEKPEVKSKSNQPPVNCFKVDASQDEFVLDKLPMKSKTDSPSAVPDDQLNLRLRPECTYCGLVNDSIQELMRHTEISCPKRDLFHRLKSYFIFETRPSPIAFCKICYNKYFITRKLHELIEHVFWCAVQNKIDIPDTAESESDESSSD